MIEKQPEALRLVDELLHKSEWGLRDPFCEAAVQIRGLVEAIERKDALLRQALEAMKDFDYDKRLAAIAAIKQELSQ